MLNWSTTLSALMEVVAICTALLSVEVAPSPLMVEVDVRPTKSGPSVESRVLDALALNCCKPVHVFGLARLMPASTAPVVGDMVRVLLAAVTDVTPPMVEVETQLGTPLANANTKPFVVAVSLESVLVFEA